MHFDESDDSKNAPLRPITVLAADDHPMFLDGIASVLAGEPGIKLIGRAGNGVDALRLFRELRPDVTLMDILMRGTCGIETMETILSEFPAARILVLTTYEGDGYVARAMRAGAFGYLIKSGLRQELLSALRCAYAGRRATLSGALSDADHHTQIDRLTARELDVLRLVADGNSNRRVGEQLQISEETVKTHMKNLLPKLGANDRAHAVALAIGRGMLPAPGRPAEKK